LGESGVIGALRITVGVIENRDRFGQRKKLLKSMHHR